MQNLNDIISDTIQNNQKSVSLGHVFTNLETGYEKKGMGIL